MDLDFVIFAGRQVSVDGVDFLVANGFIVIKTSIPGMKRKVMYSEEGRTPLVVTEELLSFYLKVYATALVNYDGVFVFDLDTLPVANLLDLHELKWLATHSEPPQWELLNGANEDGLVVGGFFFVRPNMTRCESMMNRIKRANPW